MKNISFLVLKILCIFLPFHALLVTLSTKYFLGGDKDSLPIVSFGIAMWKEILIGLLLLISIKNIRSFKWATIDWCILGYILLHLIYALYQTTILDISMSQTIWGLRTNLEMFLIFWSIRLIPISKDQIKTLIKIIIVSTTISLVFGIFQLFMTCEQLQIFGYTPYISSWVADKPLPCGHAVGASLQTIRVMGTFSGPNQLASFLLLTIGLLIVSLQQKYIRKNTAIILLVIHSTFLILTLARGALLGGLIAVCLGIYSLNKNTYKKYLPYIITLISVGIIFIGGMAITRPTSTQEHIEKPLLGIERVIEHPFGIGVGKAGPVSLRFPPDGSEGKISENWYIQIAEEIGIIGLILLIIILFLFLQKGLNNQDPLFKMLTYVTIALMINSLFLHTLANDMITSITLFLLFALAWKPKHP